MLADLTLQNFRSYKDSSFKFNPSVNIIVGPNASGKTNLLEGVLMVGKGKSYRAKDSELIQINKDWGKLNSGLTDGGSRIVKLTNIKTFQLDGKEYRRLSLDKTLPIVLFEPNHLQLLSGSPERRRDYLDDLLEQTVLSYSKARRQYLRVLSQRNNLLKQLSLDKNHIFPWDLKLSQLAGQIVRERVGLVSQINQVLQEIYQQLSGDKAKINLNYLNNWPPDVYESSLLKGLEANISNDRMRGFTTLGPHREDFDISLNSHKAQLVASRGETRTILLALKIIELHITEQARQAKPLFLLDDVFSELDENRRHNLVNYLEGYQVFITTTNADMVLKEFKAEHSLIKL